MKFMGSKAKHAKDILPIILKDRKPGQWYVEPFVGGGNVIDKVEGNRFGYDNNKYLIELLKAVRDGWEPMEIISEELYNDVKKFPTGYEDHVVGFIGFGCSYGGKWFGGYARGDGRNYAK